MTDQEKKDQKLSQQDPTVALHGSPCPPGSCDMRYCDTNSYGVMLKCTKCGGTTFVD